MSKTSAVKIEIELEQPKIEAPPAAIASRLIVVRPAPTLEEINEKLEKATAKRQETMQLRCPAENRMSRQERSRL